MAYYLHIEKKNDGIIASGSSIDFDFILKQSTTDGTPDFDISQDNSLFGIKKAGTFSVQWYMSQMSGLATNGQAFRLQYKNELEEWEYLGDGTSHIKVSSSSGFGIIEITDEMISKSSDATVWIRLINISNQDVSLSYKHLVKGALIIYSVGDRIFNADGIFAGISWDLDDASWKKHILGKQLLDKDIFPFDYLKSSSYYGGIGLIDEGVFKVTSPGKYKIEWEIPITTIDYKYDGVAGLYVNGDIYSYSHLPLTRGIINGTAIIDVWYDQEATIYLKNLSGCTIHLARYSNLTITYICPPAKRY